MWQTLARKARFIEQVMTARGTGRSVEGDISGGPMPTNYSEIMAVSSGNPLIFELANAQHELSRLSRLERAHHDSQRSLSQRKSIAEGALEPTRADTVSYTHLDVYKRQHHALDPGAPNVRPGGAHPVSYTHLDVYKRQV